MNASLNRRRRKLVKPALQLRIVGAFVGLAVVSFALQWLLLSSKAVELAASIPTGGEYVAQSLPGLFVEVLLVSLGFYMPLCCVIGILVTFRIAGPLYRIERYLRDVHHGDETQECRLRKGDELQELCDVVNLVTEPLRQANRLPAGEESERAEAASPAA